MESPRPIAVVGPSGRFTSVDALRGLIMMIMAIDHASAFIARQHGIEFWAGAMSYYSDAFPFLTRLVTHLCAPGFFFLMGAGAYWYAASRSGVDGGNAWRKIVWRGVVLAILGLLFETPLMFVTGLQKRAPVSLNTVTAPPPTDGSSLWVGLIVLVGLGMVLVVCGLLLRLKPWTWLATAALCVFATNTLLPASGNVGPLWMTVLLAPGLSQHVIVLYPLIPWLAASAAGMYFGLWWKRDSGRAGRQVWIPGLVLLLAGLALRAAGGWGNIRPPRDGGWIEFLNNVKYPPSFVFLLLAIGVNLLLLAVLVRLPSSWKSPRSPLVVFGQSPLFFYVVHFSLLMAMGFAFFPEAGSLAMAWVMWAVALVVLYPVCLWYRNFKLGKPRESFWRLL